MAKTKNLSGIKFNRITVIGKSHKGPNGWLWRCACSCGGSLLMLQYDILKGKTKSCGCYHGEQVSARLVLRNTTHGLSKTREYKIWQGIKKRVFNQKSQAFSRYGGRGITLSKDWESFENFYSDMGKCPDNYSLDRIDNEKGYCKQNCRWADGKTQANNKRTNRILTVNGESLTMAQAAEKYGVGYQSLFNRLKSGWSVLDSVSTPPMKNGSTFV